VEEIQDLLLSGRATVRVSPVLIDGENGRWIALGCPTSFLVAEIGASHVSSAATSDRRERWLCADAMWRSNVPHRAGLLLAGCLTR
jgi:hypothetical protein